MSMTFLATSMLTRSFVLPKQFIVSFVTAVTFLPQFTAFCVCRWAQKEAPFSHSLRRIPTNSGQKRRLRAAQRAVQTELLLVWRAEPRASWLNLYTIIITTPELPRSRVHRTTIALKFFLTTWILCISCSVCSQLGVLLLNTWAIALALNV